MTISALKTRKLGKGLGTLLSDTDFDFSALTVPAEEKISHLPLKKLQPGRYQPRQAFSQASLQELATSIEAQGVIQPVIVRKTAYSHYEIIAGERRWRAAQLAGLAEIPVIIRNVPDSAVIAMALIENIQREDLNALEEAHALKRLQDEFQLTHLQIAEAIGKSRVAVTHLLGLLDLHPEVQQLLQSAVIDKGHAKALMGLSFTDQSKAALLIVNKKLSVRETEKLIQQWGIKNAQPVKKLVDPDIVSLEQKLSDQLGTPVVIQHNKNNRGKLIIHYRNLDSLESILQKFS